MFFFNFFLNKTKIDEPSYRNANEVLLTKARGILKGKRKLHLVHVDKVDVENIEESHIQRRQISSSSSAFQS